MSHKQITVEQRDRLFVLFEIRNHYRELEKKLYREVVGITRDRRMNGFTFDAFHNEDAGHVEDVMLMLKNLDIQCYQ